MRLPKGQRTNVDEFQREIYLSLSWINPEVEPNQMFCPDPFCDLGQYRCAPPDKYSDNFLVKH